jgi:hypothetical protein
MRPKLLIPLLLLLALGACTSARQRGPLPPAQERTTVRVENQNFLDMNIYVLRGTQRVRLGMVTGVSTRTFTLPDNLVFGMATLRFQADPVGRQQAPISHEITVRAGEQVTLLIPNFR